MTESYMAPIEFKFAADEPGAFDGYGAVFGNEDGHRDIVLPGAFTKTLLAHKAAGTMPGMFAEHSAFTGGDPLPVGVWREVTEDAGGLLVKGKISALDTDHGRRLLGLMRDRALRGLSIAFDVPPGGAIYGKTADGPRRQLKQLNLHAIDIVRDPSNAEARIRQVKSVLARGDHQGAVEAVTAAIKLHRATMTAGDAPTVDERAQMLTHLSTAHSCLTGEAMPAGMKSAPTTIREFESFLREECKFSNARAREIAERGFRASEPRDEDAERAAAETARMAAFSDIGAGLKSFTLPTFED